MRPVNLIPADEQRHGTKKPLRTGPVAYLLIGGLVAVLGAVTLMVTTQNKIADSNAQIETLKQQEAQATAHADGLKAYAEFATAQQARTATVASLAQSRFDWERVLRELTYVIPPDVTVQALTGTANPEVQIGQDQQSDLRSQIPGPALSIAGCALGQDGVATFVAALEDIDGVTRVGLSNTQKDGATATSAAGGSVASNKPCPGGTHFTIVVAFDDAVLAATPATPGSTTSTTATPASSTTAPAPATTTATTPTGSDGGVSDAAQQQADAATSIQQGAQAAETAASSAGN